MDPFTLSTPVDLQCYPNYSFEVGDVDGDGRMEFAWLDTSAGLLRVKNLDNRTLFEKTLGNNGNWGTAPVCVADINHDGRCEIIVPDGPKVVVLDGAGRTLAEAVVGTSQRDVFGIGLPLLGTARVTPGGGLSMVATAAGGEVCALDASLNVLWKTGGFRRDFGHEIHFADVDGDGLDEIAFCTVDNCNEGPGPANTGEFVLLDHDGKILLRKRVEDYIRDTHFDDVAMADFTGDGTTQILLEKGFLIDLAGNVLWDLSKQMEHGQWIAHAPAPEGKGRTAFISELWGGDGLKSLLFTGRGKVIRNLRGFPWPAFAEPNADMARLPARAQTVRWDAKSAPEFFIPQQAVAWENGHTCMKTRHFRLSGFFMDLRGNPTGEIHYDETRVEGFYYNGEVHSRVADVDGDGRPEIVFPKNDGRVMMVKRG